MRIFNTLTSALIFFALLLPILALADGGLIHWPPEVYFSETDQNAIVAWNGNEEIMIISIDISSQQNSTVLKIVPLPSNPTKIEEGSFESFTEIVEIMNRKLDLIRTNWTTLGKGGAAPSSGIEITFQKQIGAHDITVVKVNDLNYFLTWLRDFTKNKGLGQKEISNEFKDGINNYLERGITYFAFDMIDASPEKESVKPLVYRFNSDSLYYPLKITALSEVGSSQAQINVFLITKEEIYPYSLGYIDGWFNLGYPVEFTQEELKEISPELPDLIGGSAKVRNINDFTMLSKRERDLVIYDRSLWQDNLWIGKRGEAVKALQKLLINENLWNSDVEATGYFGPITKAAVIKFQEKFASEILKPLELTKGTGFVGVYTRKFLNAYASGISPRPDVK